MKCQECAVQMQRRDNQQYIESRWDKHGAVTLLGISTDTCLECGGVYPVIPKRSSLMELYRTYPGVRMFSFELGEWVVMDWQKGWKLKTDLQVGDKVRCDLGDDEGEEEGVVLRIEQNSYGYDILTLKPAKAGLDVQYLRSRNHNRCRKVEG